MLDQANKPVLVFCTTGKVRTTLIHLVLEMLRIIINRICDDNRLKQVVSLHVYESFTAGLLATHCMNSNNLPIQKVEWQIYSSLKNSMQTSTVDSQSSNDHESSLELYVCLILFAIVYYTTFICFPLSIYLKSQISLLHKIIYQASNLDKK